MTLVRVERYKAYELGQKRRSDKLFEVIILDLSKGKKGVTGAYTQAEDALVEAQYC
jgi:hypothetical protein